MEDFIEGYLAWVRERVLGRLVAARLAVASLFFVNGMLFATWVSRIPAIEEQRGLSHATLGLALLLLAFGAMISMPAAGALCARFGSARVCGVGILAYCAFLPLLSFGGDAWVFALCLFLFGIAHGSVDVAMNAQAVQVERKYRRPIMSSFHALFSIGGLSGAASGGLIAALGWKPTNHFFLVAVAMGILSVVVLPHLLPTIETRTVGSRTFALPSKTLIGVGVIALCIMMGEGAMADWSAVYLRRVVETCEGIAAMGYAAFSIAMAAGRIVGDRVIARFGPENLVRAGGGLAAAGLLVALLVPSPAFVLIGLACVGAGFATIVPMAFSAAGNARDVSPGVAIASVTTMGYLGFLLGPPLIGFLAQGVGLRAALGVIVLTSVFPILLRSSLNRSAE
jgi:MFS family permease